MHSIIRRRAVLSTILAAAVALALASTVAAANTKSAARSDSISPSKHTLVVLQDDIAAGLDIDGPSSVADAVHEVLENTSEPLIETPRILDGGILKPNYKLGWKDFTPRLATSWTHPTPTKWVFKLRKGVKSCAGNEFTADDVVWSFARAKSLSGAAPISWFLANIAAILPLKAITSKDPKDKVLSGEVKKIDTYTVEFNQSGPNDMWPRMLTLFGLFPYDSKELLKHATAADPWAHKYADTVNPASFGAYCLTSWSKGSEQVLDFNKGFYRGTPQFTHIVIRKVAAGSNRVAALRSGAADVTHNLAPSQIASLRKDSKVHVFSFLHNEILAMGFNFKMAPWNLATGKLIRQAVAWVMPYNEILTSDYNGDAKRWLGDVEPTYIGAITIPTYASAPNVEKAKALLAKAGFPGGKGLEQYSKGLSLTYVVERRDLLEPLANRIKTALGSIGIPITLDPLTATEYNDRELKFDMPMFLRDLVRPFGPDAAYAALLFYVSKKNGGLLTTGDYSNPAVDKEFFAAQSTTGAPRLAHLAKLQQLVFEDMPQVPILLTPSQFAVRTGISCWQTGVHTARFWYFTVGDQKCIAEGNKTG